MKQSKEWIDKRMEKCKKTWFKKGQTWEEMFGVEKAKEMRGNKRKTKKIIKKNKIKRKTILLEPKRCKCGCGNFIKIKKHHRSIGMPNYIWGHNQVGNHKKRKPLSREHKRKISENAKINPNYGMKGRKLSKQHKEKLRVIQKKFWGENRERMLKSMQNRKKRGPHLKKTRKKLSQISKDKWKEPEYRKKQLTDENKQKRLKSMFKRPTKYEQKISRLLIKHNLPFIYTGNGTFLIGHKNPDFVNKEDRIAIEVYHNYFKIRGFGSCEEYERQRGNYFAKYGWRTIFIRTEEIESENWKGICLNKIKERGKPREEQSSHL